MGRPRPRIPATSERSARSRASGADSRGMFSRGQSADAAEGITAFLEKRPARFPDRVSDGLPDVMPGWAAPEFEPHS